MPLVPASAAAVQVLVVSSLSTSDGSSPVVYHIILTTYRVRIVFASPMDTIVLIWVGGRLFICGRSSVVKTGSLPICFLDTGGKKHLAQDRSLGLYDHHHIP